MSARFSLKFLLDIALRPDWLSGHQLLAAGRRSRSKAVGQSGGGRTFSERDRAARNAARQGRTCGAGVAAVDRVRASIDDDEIVGGTGDRTGVRSRSRAGAQCTASSRSFSNRLGGVASRGRGWRFGDGRPIGG